MYRQSPYWVPPDEDQRLALLNGESPNGAHTRVKTFLVEDRPKDIRATVTATVDDEFNRYWDERIGHLFFFESLPDSEDAVRPLLDEACGWLRDEGCTLARLSFHYGWQLPLTIDAYDEVPTSLHTYNPSYYHRSIKNAGFAAERGFVEYWIRFTPELAKEYRRMMVRSVESGVAYALVSLGCTFPIFVVLVTAALLSGGVVSGLLVFVVYSLGLGTVMVFLSVAVATSREAVANQLHRAVPWVRVISAFVLLGVGGYMLYFYWPLAALLFS